MKTEFYNFIWRQNTKTSGIDVHLDTNGKYRVHPDPAAPTAIGTFTIWGRGPKARALYNMVARRLSHHDIRLLTRSKETEDGITTFEGLAVVGVKSRRRRVRP